MINGYTKFQFDKNSREDTHQTDIAYTNYKKGFKFPHGIKGNYHHNNIMIQTGSCHHKKSFSVENCLTKTIFSHSLFCIDLQIIST